MSKVKSYDQENWYTFFCPGCGHDHNIPVNGVKNSSGATWQFNMDMDKPTFTPSIDYRWGTYADPNWEAPTEHGDWSGRCHSVVTDGKIAFLSDCTHALAGQTVELPEIH